MGYLVVVEKNKDGKIELTKEELQKMLDDAYNNGYSLRSTRYETITYPTINPAWCSTTASPSITISSNGGTSNDLHGNL